MLAYYNVPHTKSDFISRGGLREWLERHVLSYLQRYHWAVSNLGSDPIYFPRKSRVSAAADVYL